MGAGDKKSKHHHQIVIINRLSAHLEQVVRNGSRKLNQKEGCGDV